MPKPFLDEAAFEALNPNTISIIDVREPAEFAEGHMKGATNIPVLRLQELVGSLDKRRTFVVHCRSGHRAEQACQILRNAGLHAENLGGILQFSDEFKQKHMAD